MFNVVQFVGGPLDGQERAVESIYPEFHFPRLLKSFKWYENPGHFPVPVEEDVYVQLLDSSIYVYKGTKQND